MIDQIRVLNDFLLLNLKQINNFITTLHNESSLIYNPLSHSSHPHMNSSLLSSPQPSQQLEQIIKLKVQLTKYKSRIEGYKQMQTNYKRLTVKAEAMEKQLGQYHKIMETFFQRLKRLMNLLDIDYVAIFGAGEDSVMMEEKRLFGQDSREKEKLNDSISFINLNPNHNPNFTTSHSPLLASNPTLLRRINKLNSLKSISHSPNSIQFTHQDAKFHLIQSSIKSLIQSNLEYKTTLQKYEQSSGNIEMSLKEQDIIVKRLETQVRMREKELKDRDEEVEGLAKRIDQLMLQVKQREQVISKLQKDKQNMVKMYQQLQGRISELKNENSFQQQKKQQTLANCYQLLQQIKQPDTSYLSHYLHEYLKHSPHSRTPSPLIYSFNMIGADKRPQVFSESAKKRNKNFGRDKYQLVFE